MSTRRLPVYILADVSGSMQGTPIESVKSGIRQLHRDLMGDPQAIESAYLSVLTFANSAVQLVPLTEVAAFQPPDLVASGNTNFGDGLRLLLDVFDRELVRTTAEVKGGLASTRVHSQRWRADRRRLAHVRATAARPTPRQYHRVGVR